MDRTLSHAHEITPETRRKWTVIVQVFERRTARKNEAGTEFRNYMVTDTMGTKVPIVLFGSSIAFFSNTLLPFKRYYISNAIVGVTKPLYRVVEYEYTWNLRPRHLVEPYEESVPPPLPCTFTYDRFSELYRFADQPRPICIKALVVHALPARTMDESSTIRDFVVIDEEKIPMLLRVWDDLMIETDINVYARYKVPALIVAYGLKVTTHNGLSLGTKTNAYILHNPPLNEERPLKEWYGANSSAVGTLLENRAYRDTDVLFHPPNTNEVVPLNVAISTIETVKTIWTKCMLTYLPGQEALWFEACEKCFRFIDADVDWNIWCSNCQERTKVTVRAKIAVFLSHDGIIVEATIKSPDVEKLIPYTAKELKDASAKNTPLTNAVDDALQRKDVICFLKNCDKPSRGSLTRRYPILKIYTEAEVQAYNENLQNPAPEEGLAAPAVALTPPPPASTQDIGSSSATPFATSESEFFTPTALKVLEEISNMQPLEPIGIAGDTSTSTKRILAFEAISPVNDAAGNESSSCDPPTKPADASTIADDASHESPQKKLKGKNVGA